MRNCSDVGSWFRLSSALALGISLSGCGVIFGGTTETITVVSTPSEARLTTEPLTGSYTTPASLTLERKKTYTLVVWKEGYREAQFPIQRSMRTGPLILDILFTGLIGVVIDAATGGWWDLAPNEAAVELERLDETVEGPDVILVTISTDDARAGPVRVVATDEVLVRLIEN